MMPRTRRIYTVGALVLLQFIGLMLVVFFTLPGIFNWHTLDLAIYYTDSLRLFQGRLPYRDFALEYPPLALLPFALPRLVVFGLALNFTGYVWLFLVQNAIFSTLIALALVQILALWRPQRSVVLALAFYALCVSVSAPLLPWRYDLFPALLTLLGLLCVLRGRPAWAGVWLGLGVAAKLYPIVLLPIVGAYYLASKDWRALSRLIVSSAVTLALTLAPFVLLAPTELLSFLRYHELRGLQLESLPAGLIVLAHVLGKTAASLAFNYGALHLVAPLATVVLAWLPFAFVLVFGLVLLCCVLRFRQEYAADGAVAQASLLAYSVAALLTFIVTNKVFSPQYIIWLLPFAPLLRWRQAGLMLVICALTIALFPFDYERLLAMKMVPVLLLNLRNLLVLGLLCWLIYDYAPALSRATLAGRIRPRAV